jgi:hypothetical protein
LQCSQGFAPPTAPARPSAPFYLHSLRSFGTTTEHGNQLKGNQPEKLWINTIQKKNDSENNHFSFQETKRNNKRP